MLVDDLYNDGKKKVRELYDKVWSKLPFDVEWTSYMRLDMFWADPESIEIVKASGARAGNFGIETLHNKAGAKVILMIEQQPFILHRGLYRSKLNPKTAWKILKTWENRYQFELVCTGRGNACNLILETFKQYLKDS